MGLFFLRWRGGLKGCGPPTMENPGSHSFLSLLVECVDLFEIHFLHSSFNCYYLKHCAYKRIIKNYPYAWAHELRIWYPQSKNTGVACHDVLQRSLKNTQTMKVWWALAKIGQFCGCCKSIYCILCLSKSYHGCLISK